MQLNDSELKKLIEAVIAVLKAQNVIAAGDTVEAPETFKDVFVLFTAPWDNRFLTFAEELKNIRHCRFYGVLSPELTQQEAARLQTLLDWKEMTTWEEAPAKNLEGGITVLPVTTRDTIVKTALCISDTYETKWIKAAMARGGTIVLPRNGFERFTGREPEKYRQKLLSYYRDLLEMNVELPESFEKYMR